MPFAFALLHFCWCPYCPILARDLSFYPFLTLNAFYPSGSPRLGLHSRYVIVYPLRLFGSFLWRRVLNKNLVLVLFNRYLHDVHCVPEIALSSLQILSHVFPYNNPMSMVLLSLLQRWGNWGPWKISNLSRFTLLVKSEPVFEPRGSGCEVISAAWGCPGMFAGVASGCCSSWIISRSELEKKFSFKVTGLHCFF